MMRLAEKRAAYLCASATLSMCAKNVLIARTVAKFARTKAGICADRELLRRLRQLLPVTQSPVASPFGHKSDAS